AKHLRDCDTSESASIAHRLADLHDAFRDPSIQALICIRGGWNVNQLLDDIDYGLIKRNPKILCGYSDITALGNAIYAKTGLVTYSGPNFAVFACDDLPEYTSRAFEAAVMQSSPIDVRPSRRWTDEVFSPGKPRHFRNNSGWWPVNGGTAKGTILGGNLCTLSLLQGTQYMPKAKDVILLVEDDHETHPRTFDRDLTSLTQQPWFGSVRGVLFGRFQTTAVNTRFGPVTKKHLLGTIANNRHLRGLPVIANVDFGHTQPMLTLPIGGTLRMHAGAQSRIEILEH
ncbi:MAG TPA: LD-carboxypeptidase, partial [Candidatus Peribacteria bacterium]|nr:LD-carboxypeptidase [Candidatus Peribacteria bacterium]